MLSLYAVFDTTNANCEANVYCSTCLSVRLISETVLRILKNNVVSRLQTRGAHNVLASGMKITHVIAVTRATYL
jgi:hypothetical protein